MSRRRYSLEPTTLDDLSGACEEGSEVWASRARLDRGSRPRREGPYGSAVQRWGGPGLIRNATTI
jgi:hypothetical protein